MKIPTLSAAIAAGILTAVVAQAQTQAQPYPNKPIRWLVGFTPGSTIDVVSRLVAEEIRRKTGQTIVVENRPGALGQIAAEATAKAAPDGYTVTASSSATHSSGPRLVKNVPYDAIRDFVPLAAIMKFDLVLVANPSGPYRSVADLIAAGRSRPGKLTYGYGSATGQVASASFARAAGLQSQGVSYKGQPQALSDLMGGQLDYVMVDVGAALALIQAGKLAVLAIASDKRSTILPDVATLQELGVKDVVLQGWVGVSGPAAMAPEAIAWWTRHVTEAMSQKEVGDRMRALGLEPVADGLSGEAFDRFVRAQYELWGRHIAAAGIAPE